MGEFLKQPTKMIKIWSETIVFSYQLRQHPQIVIDLGKNAGYIFTSSLKYVTSTAVVMEILCITNFGSNSSEKILDIGKLL